MEIQIFPADGFRHVRRNRRTHPAVRICPQSPGAQRAAAERQYSLRNRRSLLVVRADQLRDHQPLQRLRGPGLCHQLPENAIEFNRAGKAVINHDLCISCGICHSNCPYHAIVYMPVPCEEACPVKAITKDERGVEHIDESKCIYCGKCINSCPFGAIFEISQVFDVLQRLREGERWSPSSLRPFSDNTTPPRKSIWRD